MKLLSLTKGKYAQVDDEDYYWLSQWNWFAIETKGAWYARRSKKKGVLRSGEPFEVYLHRVVMRCSDKTKVVDHRDHDGLNCQKVNLRTCTKSENNRNLCSRKGSSSSYLGVTWDSSRSKWSSRLKCKGKTFNIGRFNNEIEAAKAYDLVAKEQFGNFANLNFKN